MEQVEHLAAPPLDSATAVLALIERVALDPGADVEKLDRIVAMYERVKAKEAELAFNAAKGRILKKLAGIKFVRNRPAITNTCGRYWLKRIWICPIPTNRGTAAASGSAAVLSICRAVIMRIPLCRRRSTPRVASRRCRQRGAPILSSADTSPATSSTLWLPRMMATALEER